MLNGLTPPALSGRCIVIVGGAGDIGQAIARGARVAGAQVFVLDLPVAIARCLDSTVETAAVTAADTAVEAATWVQDKYGIAYMAVDCTQAEAVGVTVAAVIAAAGRCDALVAAAGHLLLAPFSSISPQQLQQCFASNVFANFYALQAVLPYMQQQGYGRMVLLTSDQAVHGRRLGCAYAMTKAAMLQLTRGLTADLQGAGDVRANALLLGTVAKTRMTQIAAEQLALQQQRSVSEVLADFAAEQPSGQLVSLTRVTAWALALCSEQATDCAGAVLALDGGLSVVR